MVESSNKVCFIITGFGPFYGVKENPTTILINSITDKEQLQFDIIHKEILEVSIQSVEQFVKNIENKIQQIIQEHQDIKIIFIHNGVSAGQKQIKLEQLAYNKANFNCPDMKNNICHNKKICPDLELDFAMMTNLNINQLTQDLSQNHKCCLSTDPGRYICNYIYFSSLQAYNNIKNCTSIFIHYPSFQDMNFEQQRKFFFDALTKIKNIS